jgi:hypothetical protein
VHPFPGSIHSPGSKIMVDGLPGWEVVRQESPSAAALHDVEDSVEDLPRAMEPGASAVVGGR